ncbi:MAG TPA: carboxylesterase family protein [Gammaproteobacteria bacterium]|nr:carboxylesterase family protein [Gammaproteobacteria bacterium]
MGYSRSGVGAAVLLCALSFAANAQITTARVTGGQIEGTAASGIASFKGIPFAAPPVGDLRWKKPQPVVAWSGVKKANAYGAACMQDPAMLRFTSAPEGVSEDCLYLNVWTPAKAATDRLPVMVWIYGGGFAAGATSSSTYEGTRLAEKGVVVVSVAYRIGPFGFLAHPELSKESGKGSGNYGLQDMIAGLEWVKANIAALGGDPRNVTIFGESAGGIAVSMLGASPAAKGLFAKAISESGGNFAPPRHANEGGQNVPTLPVAEKFGAEFFTRLGAQSLSDARKLSAEQIQKVLPPGLGGGFWPVADGDVLPGDQYVLYSQGKFNDTPVLIGTNSDEGALFARGPVTPAAYEKQIRDGYGERADAILAANPHATDADAATAAKNIFRDSAFAWPTWAWARLQSSKGKGAVYVYYYDHRTPQSPNGATHAAELTYVFRNLATLPAVGGDSANSKPRPEDVAMSELVSSYWTNFAKTGDPNGAGLPKWPPFTESAQQAMFFDASSSARPLPNLEQLRALDGYYAWRRAQAQHAAH